ncbi:MAG: N-acetylmuramoyl-L-alanine amidase [Oscillospiraceae bacterium]|nr:N-acetylmuramoyl-L-alanine amidase [Oscillospiraceae bacterium]
MSKIIVLDPGHGGSDPGAVNGSRFESHDNLRIGMAIRELLRSQGYDVRMTRETDVFVSLDERANMALRANADLLVSLHRDSFPTTTPSGVTMFYRWQNSAEIASTLLQSIPLRLRAGNRAEPLRQGAWRVLQHSRIPGVFAELGFISNANDNRLFDEHFDEYTQSLARGIVQALGDQWRDTADETPPDDETLDGGAIPGNMTPAWRVRGGTYRNQESAERVRQAFIRALAEEGIDDRPFLEQIMLPK